MLQRQNSNSNEGGREKNSTSPCIVQEFEIYNKEF